MNKVQNSSPVVERLERRALLSATLGTLTTLGSKGFDSGNTVLADSSGNMLVAGPFSLTVDFNPNHPGTTLVNSNRGSLDGFVAKYAANGDLDWVHTIGGPGYDPLTKMATDTSGNIYVTGSFQKKVRFGKGVNATMLTDTGASAIYVAKYDPAGDLLWAKVMGGGGTDQGRGIAVDPSGNVYITGAYEGGGDFDPGAGVFNLPDTGTYNAFLVKLDTDGNFIWAKNIGGGAYLTGRDIAANASGAYLTGTFGEEAEFNVGGASSTLTANGKYDAFVARYNADGSFAWAQQMGGMGIDRGRSIGIDPSGDVVVTGIYHQTAKFGANMSMDSVSAVGSDDIFIARYDSTGTFQWVKSVGGPGLDRPRGLAIDGSGDIFLTGGFQETASFDPTGVSGSLTSRGSYDAFISELDDSGNFVMADSFGGLTSDVANSVAIGTNGTIYLTGFFSGTANFDPNGGTADRTATGQQNIFVLTLD